MAISESLYFIYDGIKSSDMGILNVNRSSGLSEEPFLPRRTINKVQVRGRTKPYFQDIQYSPLTISLRFWFENTWDEDKIREVARWLTQDYYKELYFSDNLDRRFYAMYMGDPKLIHNSLKQGYVDIEMENIDAYTYSPIYYSDTYDYSSNVAEGTDFVFTNYGDVECKPVLYLNKIGSGDDIKIINLSNGGQEFVLSNLVDNETVIIDHDNETIETDIPLTYRYNDHNGVFLEMVRGKNYLKIYGNCKLRWKYEFKTLQG